MEDKILMGLGSLIQAASSAQWEQSLSAVPLHSQVRLNFMTEIHHRTRYFVVSELVKSQHPISPKWISKALDIPNQQVENILGDLEQNLFFLVRNEEGCVTWAFPFTVQPTAHSLTFSSGERLYGA